MGIQYTPLDVCSKTKFLPLHIHYIASECSLSVLFSMIWKVLVLSMLFMAFQSYIQSHSCSLPYLSSAILALFSNSHLIFYREYLNICAQWHFFGVSTFLFANSTLICGHLLSGVPLSSAVFLDISIVLLLTYLSSSYGLFLDWRMEHTKENKRRDKRHSKQKSLIRYAHKFWRKTYSKPHVNWESIRSVRWGRENVLPVEKTAFVIAEKY